MFLDTDEEDDVVVTGALPSGICNGFIPGIQDFHTNFPFQLLPSLAHIVLSGATFHHISCSANNFKLNPSDSSNSNPNVNEQCTVGYWKVMTSSVTYWREVGFHSGFGLHKYCRIRSCSVSCLVCLSYQTAKGIFSFIIMLALGS